MSWVQNFTHSGWSSRLLALDREGHYFPDPEEDAADFVRGISEFPIVVVAVGLLSAIATLLRLCCLYPKVEKPWNRKQVASLPLGLALASCILVGAGVAFFLLHARRGELVFNAAFVDASDDMGQAASIGLDLNITGTRLLSQLDEMPTRCPPIRPIVEQQVAPLKANLATYMADVQRYNALIGPIPGRLESLDSDGRIEEGQALLFVALVVPLLLVGAACMVMVVVVLGAACFRKGSCVAQCEEYLMWGPASVVLAFTVALVAAISAGQLCFAIGLSAFCADADANFVKVLARDFGDSPSALANNRDTLVTTSRYYVTGEGPNPLLERVLEAHEALDSCDESLDEMGLYARSLAVRIVCSGDVFSDIVDDINASLRKARTEVRSCEALLEPDNIYPYYQAAVHDAACGAIIDGVAWLAIVQLVVGVVLLPFLACAAAGYVRQQAFQRKPRESAEEAIELRSHY